MGTMKGEVYSYTVPKDGATHRGLCPSISMSNEDIVHRDEPVGQSNTDNSSTEVSYSQAVDNEDWPPQHSASDRRSKVH